MPLIFQRDSYYNYGSVSPNNLVVSVNTYNTNSYTGGGTVWRDVSGNNNHMSLISTLFTGSVGQNGGISFNGTSSYAISSNDLLGYLNKSSFNQTQEVWIKNVYYNTQRYNYFGKLLLHRYFARVIGFANRISAKNFFFTRAQTHEHSITKRGGSKVV
jgi:hypothetical protein